ncbi:hypothetical protein Tco_1570653 [Tanacetum coccineum]
MLRGRPRMKASKVWACVFHQDKASSVQRVPVKIGCFYRDYLPLSADWKLLERGGHFVSNYFLMVLES